MKNIALVIAFSLLLAACSSGSTVSDVPPTITGLYSGPFEASNAMNGEGRGQMTLNLAEDTSTTAGDITGTIQIVFDEDQETCLRNAPITGTRTGFNVNLTSEQPADMGTGGGILTFQLTADNNTLNGTYVTGPGNCSNFSGSGTVNLTR